MKKHIADPGRPGRIPGGGDRRTHRDPVRELFRRRVAIRRAEFRGKPLVISMIFMVVLTVIVLPVGYLLLTLSHGLSARSR